MEGSLSRLDLSQKRSTKPKHERLKNHFLNEMLSGRLKPGQALPSEPLLAETLGVARMTVRQAMVSLENDGLIRRVKGRGSFVDDNMLSKLRRGQDIFALVVPDTRSGYYPSLLHGFANAAGQIHHQTLICDTENDVLKQSDIILQLLDKKVGGVALNPTTEPLTPAYQVRQLQERGIPVVFCHRRVEGISAPLLAIPFHEIARLAGRTLAERGHRRVVLIDSHRTSVLHCWEEGLQEGMQDGGGDTSIESVCVGDSIALSEETVFAALKKMFKKPDPPTGLFVGFDSLAEIIYLLLPRLGLRVPEDVSLIGFGGRWREGAVTRRLTSVTTDEVGTGKQAIKLLDEMRRGERAIDDNEEFVLNLELSDGQTLGYASNASI
ncbi:MAG: GntR family transcriptional regulator [Pirellulales bacterium]|nr:GntR family transcriptional regulator [Pirellulales bacterium]